MRDNPIKDKSFAFALRTIKLGRFLQEEKRAFILSKQLLRSGTAVGALVREAEQAESKPDFIHKMAIALKEANETDYWIELIYQSQLIDQSAYDSIKPKIIELIKLLVSIIKSSKAKTACEVSGHEISDHFADVRKMVDLGSGSQREIDDIMLTRHACYLVAQNGDTRKEPIAFAQTYFALQTRKAGLIEQRNNQAIRKTLLERGIRPESLPADEDVKKVERRLTSETKKSLKKIDRIDQNDFAENKDTL